MKRTMFITMLAAALVGSQVFADFIPTTTNAGEVADGFYAGKYSLTEDVSGANVTINEKQEGGEDFSQIEVYGGFTIGEQAAASNNSVTMTGGQVAAVEGGYSNSGHANNNNTTMTGGQVSTLSGGTGQTSASGNTAIMVGGSVISSMIGGQSGKDASGNTAIMVGGSVGNMIGGLSGAGFGQTSASGNIAIVAGDSVVSHTLAGGLIPVGGAANDNKIYLVGKGATATIADAQGVEAKYTGGKLSLGKVIAGGEGDTMSGNSVDIYGTGIDVRDLGMMQVLNFHIANLDDGATPMITLPSWLYLTNFLVPTEETPSPELALTFDALDSMEWKPGASVTLVNAGNGIGIDESLLGKEYNIYRNGDPDKTVLGTATLKLEQGEGTTEILKLVTNGNVPEPTTGILSLLALAALTARRRK